MPNRVKHVLRLVTVWHPEHYLRCRASELKLKPHLVRMREQSNQRRMEQHRKDGFELKSQPMEDGIVRIGHGTEVKRYRNTSIRGAQLDPLLDGSPSTEPVLIYVPDEVQGKAKWKYELRTLADWCIELQDEYPSGFDLLPGKMCLDDNECKVFWQNLRKSTLRVCGFWVNPSHNLDLPEGRSINLVLGPVRGHELPWAAVRIFPDDKRCWIEYEEELRQ